MYSVRKLGAIPTVSRARSTVKAVEREGSNLPLRVGSFPTLPARVSRIGRLGSLFGARPLLGARPLWGARPSPASGDPAPAPSVTALGSEIFPPRHPAAPSGSEFMAGIRDLPIAQREAAIMQEVLAGNVPDFLRELSSVRVRSRGADGQTHEAIIPVMPDYLAVGHDGDFVRVPLSPLMAQRIADRLGLGLPTRKSVDDVYRQAATRIAPRPMPPVGHQMMSADYFDRHNRTIEGQLAGHRPADLVAGHKKDVIISNAVGQHPGKVIIYGWHQPDGKAIQPLSWIHENTYSDYSHGVRFVGQTIMVDGQPRKLTEILADRDLCGLVSDEGPILSPRYPV